jgi:hypothetical protein
MLKIDPIHLRARELAKNEREVILARAKALYEAPKRRSHSGSIHETCRSETPKSRPHLA